MVGEGGGWREEGAATDESAASLSDSCWSRLPRPRPPQQDGELVDNSIIIINRSCSSSKPEPTHSQFSCVISVLGVSLYRHSLSKKEVSETERYSVLERDETVAAAASFIHAPSSASSVCVRVQEWSKLAPRPGSIKDTWRLKRLKNYKLHSGVVPRPLPSLLSRVWCWDGRRGLPREEGKSISLPAANPLASSSCCPQSVLRLSSVGIARPSSPVSIDLREEGRVWGVRMARENREGGRKKIVNWTGVMWVRLGQV